MTDRNANIYDLSAYRIRKSDTPVPADVKADVPAPAPPSKSGLMSAAPFAMPAAFFTFWPALPPDQPRDDQGGA